MADLRAAVDAAHERGLWVILDMPLQHMAGPLLEYGGGRGPFRAEGYPVDFAFSATRSVPLPLPTFFRDRAVRSSPRCTFGRFHRYGVLGRYDDQGADLSEAELGDLFGLSDLATESAEVRAAMVRIAQYWIAQADVDGFRLDAVKHADLGFWQAVCPAVRAFAAGIGKERFVMFGESLDGDAQRLARYTAPAPDGAAVLDGMENYPWYFAVRAVFADRLPTGALEGAMRHGPEPADAQVTFLDNHDQPRFLEVVGGRRGAGVQRLRTALALLLLSPGVPAIYYGTEQGFDGERDQRNREDMFFNPEWAGDAASEGQDSFNPVHPLYRFIRRLHLLREWYPELAGGEMHVRWHDAPDTRGAFVFSRLGHATEAVVAMNLGDRAIRLERVPPPGERAQGRRRFGRHAVGR